VLTSQHSSPFIKRLLKNKGASFGLILIVVSLLLALLCYFISPDPSPNANRMIPEIGSKKPGYSVLLLRTKRDKIVTQTGLFKRLLSGAEESYQYIPVVSYFAER
jgi:hypothetical protein